MIVVRQIILLLLLFVTKQKIVAGQRLCCYTMVERDDKGESKDETKCLEKQHYQVDIYFECCAVVVVVVVVLKRKQIFKTA
jgi:hypothetical protein